MGKGRSIAADVSSTIIRPTGEEFYSWYIRWLIIGGVCHMYITVIRVSFRGGGGHSPPPPPLRIATNQIRNIRSLNDKSVKIGTFLLLFNTNYFQLRAPHRRKHTVLKGRGTSRYH